ncbi:hypothetical protein J2S40_003654 [Nocardioides luteus]|uniref:Dihydrodiol dehydrogenase n=1 Tax=Nocardioides luteus TaxID=1844 RepID=A0ABQ5SXX1_9ACTN|nr:hypothetical protein [Nocardioides luteus]MDR7312596.1 hypothetical protein [Nocardioides luteus]GLJ68844.1 hypothetical protein GCM10017579_28800 [Nocardioides luteus]
MSDERPHLEWEGESEDRAAAMSAARRRAEFLEMAVGDPIVIANEFSEIRVVRVNTRNGARLLIDSPKSGQWITLDPLELEALTWQNEATLSAMVGNIAAPLIPDAQETNGSEEEDR